MVISSTDASASKGSPAGANEQDPLVSVSEQVCAPTRSGWSTERWLGAERDNGARSESRFGLSITPARAERIDYLEQIRGRINFNHLRTQAESLSDASFVSATWSYDAGVEVRVTADHNQGDILRLFDEFDLNKADAKIIQLGPEARTHSERSSLYQQVIELINSGEADELGIATVSDDEWCGIIRIGVDARDGRGLTDVRAALEENHAFPTTGVVYFVDDHDVEPAIGRDQYQSTQSGGLLEDNSGCTSNVPWYRASTGQRFLVTAAHCVPQTHWNTTPSDWDEAWWTLTTATGRSFRQGGSQVSNNSTSHIRYGAELDVAIWTTSQPGSPRTAGNRSTQNYWWYGMGWWQWSPTWVTDVSGGDAIGDLVCQSGATTAHRPGTSINVVSCGGLYDRSFAFSPNTGPGVDPSWFYHFRRSAMDVCGGDSGGTVWRSNSGGDRWLSGVVHGGYNESDVVNGQQCYSRSVYSHVGYMPSAFNLTAPVDMS